MSRNKKNCRVRGYKKIEWDKWIIIVAHKALLLLDNLCLNLTNPPKLFKIINKIKRDEFI